MQSQKSFSGLTAVLAICAAAFFLAGTATSQEKAQHFKLLHSFNGTDGLNAQAGLIFDAAGNLYGTTGDGGADSVGTAFELSRNAAGRWSETVLHNFGSHNLDATYPYAALLLDAEGNLYSTSNEGGAYGYGTVFELKRPAPGGTWNLTVLHSFNNTDGSAPWAPLIVDAAGNFYATTRSGGAYGNGTAFKLTHAADASWTETVLHSFGSGSDGSDAVGTLIFDAAGNLYGLTAFGGTYGLGTAFELSPTESAGWTETVLHNFGSGSDGSYPFTGGLVFDPAGNLYGSTTTGGTCGAGTVFEMTPVAGGSWTEQVLHDFGCTTDGVYTQTGVIRDAAGNLYGTSVLGGLYANGTVFELIPTAGGIWTENVLFNFDLTDGNGPQGLLFDAVGNLYSANSLGGRNDDGTVAEITP
jgi:uncharacterized repeat protein (TIGR03803 family)